MSGSTPISGTHSRRELLKMAPLAAAGLLLTETGRSWVLRHGLSLSDRASALAFDSSHLAPTFGDHEVTAVEHFPLVGVRVTNVLSARRGYWEDQGYGWYGGV